MKLWRIKLFFHYWFSDTPWSFQIGDFVYSSDPINEINELFKKIFTEQIAGILVANKYSLVGDVTIIIINDPSPLGRNTAAWKANVNAHTRKSWEMYLHFLIEKQIRFKEGAPSNE